MITGGGCLITASRTGLTDGLAGGGSPPNWRRHLHRQLQSPAVDGALHLQLLLVQRSVEKVKTLGPVSAMKWCPVSSKHWKKRVSG